MPYFDEENNSFKYTETPMQRTPNKFKDNKHESAQEEYENFILTQSPTPTKKLNVISSSNHVKHMASRNEGAKTIKLTTVTSFNFAPSLNSDSESSNSSDYTISDNFEEIN